MNSEHTIKNIRRDHFIQINEKDSQRRKHYRFFEIIEHGELSLCDRERALPVFVQLSTFAGRTIFELSCNHSCKDLIMQSGQQNSFRRRKVVFIAVVLITILSLGVWYATKPKTDATSSDHEHGNNFISQPRDPNSGRKVGTEEDDSSMTFVMCAECQAKKLMMNSMCLRCIRKASAKGVHQNEQKR